MGVPVTIWMDEELLADIDEAVAEDARPRHRKEFRNRSHFIERACVSLLVETGWYEEEEDEE